MDATAGVHYGFINFQSNIFTTLNSYAMVGVSQSQDYKTKEDMMRHTRTVPIRYPKRSRGGGWILISTMWLEEQAAHDLEAARNECLRRFNDHLLITDMGRSHAQQEALYRLKPRCAARPGHSWHEAGLAIDVDMAHLNTLTGGQLASEAFLREFGWQRTCWERWHFENHRYYPRSKGVTHAIAEIDNVG